MRKRGEAESSEAQSCKGCTDPSPVTRAVHTLQFRNTDLLARHLRGQPNGEDDQKSGWIASRERFWHFVHKYYGEKADSDGNPVPAWRAWLEHGGATVTRQGNRWLICGNPNKNHSVRARRVNAET